MTDEPRLRPVLRLADLAAHFDVSRQTIFKWRRAGELDEIEHADPGGRPYYFEDELESWSRSRSSSEDATAGAA